MRVESPQRFHDTVVYDGLWSMCPRGSGVNAACDHGQCEPSQKGRYAGSRRRTVIGLDHQLGPIPRKYGREGTPSRAARL
jgi:hypothetical protein